MRKTRGVRKASEAGSMLSTSAGESGDWILLMPYYFFFSSRRRHTRLQGDWSSDVCSSDLDELGSGMKAKQTPKINQTRSCSLIASFIVGPPDGIAYAELPWDDDGVIIGLKIGRASCRERV